MDLLKGISDNLYEEVDGNHMIKIYYLLFLQEKIDLEKVKDKASTSFKYFMKLFDSYCKCLYIYKNYSLSW